jgi:hypothetical protein
LLLTQLDSEVIIRNIKPSHPVYSFSELYLHAEELMNLQLLDHLEHYPEYEELDEEDPKLRFKLFIEKRFVDTRSIALQSIRQGLTLNGEQALVMCSTFNFFCPCCSPFPKQNKIF